MINSANLTVENAPPIEIPFRFFLTAPLFGVLFALVPSGWRAVGIHS